MRGVAIPYTIAVILGVIVIALIGYWFVFQGGKTLGAGTNAQCESACAVWRNTGFTLKPVGIENNCKSQLTGAATIQPPPNTIQIGERDQVLNLCAMMFGCQFKSTSCSENENSYGYNDGTYICCAN